MRYMGCVPPLDKVDEAVKRLCLQRPTARSGEGGRNVEVEGEDGDAAAAAE